MNKEELLIQKNSGLRENCRITLNNKRILYKNKSKVIDLSDISRILSFMINAREKYNFSFFPLQIDLGRCTFEDKLSFVLLEVLVHYYLDNDNARILMNFACKHTIFNEGIKSSFLRSLNGHPDNQKILKMFISDISSSHYRKVIKKDTADVAIVSRIVQDVDSFLKVYSVADDYRNAVSEVVGELIDNALDHAQSDCLFDLDITSNYIKANESDGSKYYGVNIVIMNFSDILLGERISHKLDRDNLSERYLELKKAYNYHSKFFSDEYENADFFTVASFQHKISSRDAYTGGTGLTSLIKNLEDKSDAYSCYVLTGNRKLNFIKDYLIYDENEWIGFNDENNFISGIPNKVVIKKSPFFFPGTAYNLNFVLKRED